MKLHLSKKSISGTNHKKRTGCDKIYWEYNVERIRWLDEVKRPHQRIPNIAQAKIVGNRGETKSIFEQLYGWALLIRFGISVAMAASSNAMIENVIN